MPEYINYRGADLATASLVVSIKHSLKCLPERMLQDTTRIENLRLIYSKWISIVYSSYEINKDLIKVLIKKIGVFLERVCQ